MDYRRNAYSDDRRGGYSDDRREDRGGYRDDHRGGYRDEDRGQRGRGGNDRGGHREERRDFGDRGGFGGRGDRGGFGGRARGGFVSRPLYVPERSEKGEVEILTNHFMVDMELPAIEQYRVDSEPPVAKYRIRKVLELRFKNLWIMSGETLYLQERLPKATEVIEEQASADGDAFNVILKHTRTIQPSAEAEYLQVQNILVRQVLDNMDLTQNGRAYFNHREKREVRKLDVEIWPGYKTAIGSTQGEIDRDGNARALTTLCVDVVHKVIRRESALDTINDLLRSHGQKEASMQFQGSFVYCEYSNQTYMVDGIDWEQKVTNSFTRETRDGKQESVRFIDYFKQRYGYNVRDQKQPMLVVTQKRTKNKIYLIPELCRLTGITEKMRAIGLKDIQANTIKGPQRRSEMLDDFYGRIQESLKKKNDWNIKISEMTNIMCKQIEPLSLLMRQGVGPNSRDLVQTLDYGAQWDRALSGQGIAKFGISKNLTKWAIAYVEDEMQQDSARDFVDEYLRIATSLGVTNISRPVEIPVKNGDPEDWADAMNRLKPLLPTRITSIRNTKETYARIKKILTIEKAIVSQCVCLSNLQDRKKRSVITKITHQVNSKVGGVLWQMHWPERIKAEIMQSIMFIGIDIAHDKTSLDKGKKSIAAFCATITHDFGRYYTAVCIQEAGQEMVDGLRRCTMDALTAYSKENGKLPERVVIYRDGVSDAVTKLVLDYELPQFYSAFEDTKKGWKPEVVLIIVKRRGATRLFASKVGVPLEDNPAPGTVCDHTVVKHLPKGQYEFLLVSQKVTQGSVTPTRYHVLYNTTKLSPNVIQRITFGLCHLYFNWPGTIAVPAPVQYASKCAFLTTQSVHDFPHPDLSKSLYFL